MSKWKVEASADTIANIELHYPVLFVPERTCQVIARHDGPHVYEHELSCGHSCEWVWDGPPAFCPSCGAKVIE